MKRLIFKKPFNGLGKALDLIPESYKVDAKEFEMTDGNENYTIRWEGSLNEGSAVVTRGFNKQLVSEELSQMKRLMNYNSQSTLGTLKGSERLDENASFNEIFDKTRKMLSEAKTVESKSFLTESIGDISSAEGKEMDEAREMTKEERGPDAKDLPAPPTEEEEQNNIVTEEEDCDVVEESEKVKDRFDEVFEGYDDELSDEQSEEMDTDKDGDIDAKDLKNLRKEK
jgi:hypothetical protein